MRCQRPGSRMDTCRPTCSSSAWSTSSPPRSGRPGLGEDREPGLGGADDRDVERAGAEVVHGERLARRRAAGRGRTRSARPRRPAPARGRGCRPCRRGARPRAARCGAPAPTARDGSAGPRPACAPPSWRDGLVADPAQHGRERLGDRHDHGRRAAACPRRRAAWGSARTGPGPAGHAARRRGRPRGCPSSAANTRGRHRGGPVHLDHPWRPAVRGQHGDRVGRTEVNRQDGHDSPLCTAGQEDAAMPAARSGRTRDPTRRRRRPASRAGRSSPSARGTRGRVAC